MKHYDRIILSAALALALNACGVAPAATSRQPDLEATNQALRETIEAQQSAAAVPVTAASTATREPAESPSAAPTASSEPLPAEQATAETETPAPASTLSDTAPVDETIEFAPRGEAQPPAASNAPPANSPSDAPGGPSSSDPTSFSAAEGSAEQTLNIELVFDSSGSMAEDAGGETRIEAGRRAMQRVIEGLPEANGTLNVGFRVYGHRGDNTEAGKAESCQSTELLVPVQGVDRELLRQQTNAWQPTGWTPISLALQRAGEDLPAAPNVRNLIIMVTDGEETCAGDPCAVAKALAESSAEVRIDVVGFGLAPEVADTLKCIPENSGGLYIEAGDGAALARTLQELISGTVNRGTLRIKALDPDGQPIEVYATISDENGRPPQTIENAETGGYYTPSFMGQTLVDLDPGNYLLDVNSPKDPQAYQGSTGYRVTVVDGRETVALVGLGGVTFRNAGVEASQADELELQQEIDGAWEAVVRDYRFEFGRRYSLQGGRYRVVHSTSGDAATTDTIVVQPGASQEVPLGLSQRGTLLLKAIDGDGQPIEVYVTITDENGDPPGVIEDADNGDYYDPSFVGENRVSLLPGTYVLDVNAPKTTHAYQGSKTFRAIVALGQTTIATIGRGGVVFEQQAGGSGMEDELQLEEIRNGTWAPVVADYLFEFDRAYQLTPGRYRLVDTKREQVINDAIIVEPGKQVTVTVR